MKTGDIWDIVNGIDYWFVDAGHSQVRGEGTAVNLDEEKAGETPSAGQDADDDPTGIRRSSTWNKIKLLVVIKYFFKNFKNDDENLVKGY